MMKARRRRAVAEPASTAAGRDGSRHTRRAKSASTAAPRKPLLLESRRRRGRLRHRSWRLCVRACQQKCVTTGIRENRVVMSATGERRPCAVHGRRCRYRTVRVGGGRRRGWQAPQPCVGVAGQVRRIKPANAGENAAAKEGTAVTAAVGGRVVHRWWQKR